MPTALSCLANAAQPSPLLLSHRLLRLAEEADLAGCHITAEHLIALAHTVFDDADEAPILERLRRRRQVS
jgi:hypothetical protein